MRKAFTLVEILIVVVILGILAGVVVPQFSQATSQAKEVATLEHVTRLRRALAVYYVRNNSAFPAITAGNGSWGELISAGYLKGSIPTNDWVGGPNARNIIIRETPDTTYHMNYGWIYDPTTGNVWAAGFDAQDNAIPRP